MAEIVLAMGTSHSPLLALDAPDWEARSVNDRSNKHLFDMDGNEVSYDELLAKVGPKHDASKFPQVWAEQEAQHNRALDRLGVELAEVAPDVVVVLGDDEHELFSAANMPALAMYTGDYAVARRFMRPDDPRTQRPDYAWMGKVQTMYGMDDNHRYAVDSAFSKELFGHVMDDGFDLAACDDVPEPDKRGFGHAFGFVITRLMGKKRIPIVPVLINAYFPPNQPSPSRCYDFGISLRRAIEASSPGKRVAVIASGGLSHFVTNEPLDRTVIDALKNKDERALRSIPAKQLNSGSSEIRMWISMGGMLGDLKHQWSEYIPVYRTQAGTGIGLGFGRWS
jgi:hypothetical protein